MTVLHPDLAATAASFFSDGPSLGDRVVQWQRVHGRHDLPWQKNRTAYRVWLSEIMLQQTQVTAVIPYYERFLQRFPDVFSLAEAPVEDVMALWAGLGYYTRARNLHRCAQEVVATYQGEFPADPVLLQALPGIGRSTAAAISAFSYGTRAAIMDGNVKRVFARVFGIREYPGNKPVEDQLWLLADSLLPAEGIDAYTQGLMDLGATVCTRSKPVCMLCPLQPHCVANREQLTAELPVRKPKKAVPSKRVLMPVVMVNGQVLLEQRPPSGIWGGLLSLPEIGGMQLADDALFEPDTNAVSAFAEKFAEVQSVRLLHDFEHVFTHFRLQIFPVIAEGSRWLPQVAESRYSIASPEQADTLALPAPVRSLLTTLVQESSL